MEPPGDSFLCYILVMDDELWKWFVATSISEKAFHHGSDTQREILTRA